MSYKMQISKMQSTVPAVVAGIFFTSIIAFVVSRLLEPVPANYSALVARAEPRLAAEMPEQVLPRIVVVAKRMTDAEKASFDNAAPTGQR
jgi:hypothetical protein